MRILDMRILDMRILDRFPPVGFQVIPGPRRRETLRKSQGRLGDTPGLIRDFSGSGPPAGSIFRFLAFQPNRKLQTGHNRIDLVPRVKPA